MPVDLFTPAEEVNYTTRVKIAFPRQRQRRLLVDIRDGKITAQSLGCAIIFIKIKKDVILFLWRGPLIYGLKRILLRPQENILTPKRKKDEFLIARGL